jgi:hypothetical protein
MPAIDHFGICLVMGGTIDLLSNGARAQAIAGDIVLLDLQAPVELIRGSEGETTSELTLWIPRARLPAALFDRGGIDGRIIRSASCGTPVAAAALQALLCQIKGATAAQMDELVTAIVILVARVIARAPAGHPNASRNAVAAPLESFTTISRFIEANLVSRELGVEKIIKNIWIIPRIAIPPLRTGWRRRLLHSNSPIGPRAQRTHRAWAAKPSNRPHSLPCWISEYSRFQPWVSQSLWREPAERA